MVRRLFCLLAPRLKRLPQTEKYAGSYKVKYNPNEDWDFDMDTAQQPIDISLVLPHYRARNQPINHRMSMLVASDSGSIKLKVVRMD